MSNYLPRSTQVLAIKMLCEGTGLRPAARILDCQHQTLMRLGRDVGEGYVRLHNKMLVGLSCLRVELDEAWSFVHTKQARLEDDDPKEWGDQYSFIALDADKKAIVSYLVGKRNKPNTIGFALDLATRLRFAPQITSDGFDSYKDAIRIAFGKDADYAMLIKEYTAACAVEASVRYQSADVKSVQKIVVSGEPEEDDINTAFVERQNLTLRMLTRRFNRLTNAHSKILRNHRAAMDLYVGYYNLCWEHQTLGRTPAMALGVAGVPWTVERFVSECLALSDGTEPLRPGHARYKEYLDEKSRGRKR